MRRRIAGVICVGAIAIGVAIAGVACGGGADQESADGTTSPGEQAVWRSEDGAEELRVGDCFRNAGYEIVPCDEIHDSEVVSIDASCPFVGDLLSARAAEILSRYIGLDAEIAPAAWLESNGLTIRSDWNLASGCLSYLTGTEGALTRPHRADSAS
jgi:hypothetical protein